MNFLIKNDVIILGLLMVILGVIFKTVSSSRPVFTRFYKYVPPLLLCYFLPSFLTTFHIVDTGSSNLYFVASRYLLPAALILLTMSINLKEIVRLGPKALIMFFTGTLGIIIGGPLAMLIVHFFSPETIAGTGPESVWRGLSTVAGSWIGGAANQTAMFEIFKPSGHLFSIAITVDIVVAQIWMALLLLGAANSKQVDKFFNADNRKFEELKEKMKNYSERSARITNLHDIMIILGIAFGFTALSELFGNFLANFFSQNFPALSRLSFTSEFFWLIILSTAFGIIISFTSWRNYEGAGASKIGSLFIYILVATIGMKMNLGEVLDNIQKLYPDYPRSIIWGVVKERLATKFPNINFLE